MRQLFKTIDEAESSALVLINAKCDLTTSYRLRQVTKAKYFAQSRLETGLRRKL